MTSPKDALQQQYAAIAGVLDDKSLKFIETGEAIMKRPGSILLSQMGLIDVPGYDTAKKTTTTTTTNTEPVTLLDNACGPGLIAGVLQEHLAREVLAQSRILCADVNGNFVDILKQRAEAQGWVGVETAVLDAQNPGLPDHSFSYSTVNFGMHVIPDPDAVLASTKKLLKPGGVFGATTMHKDNIGWTADLRSALSSLPFPTEPLPESIPMAPNGATQWTDTDEIEQELAGKHGLVDVSVQVVDHTSRCLSGDDAVERFGMMIKTVTGAYWSEETRRKVDGEAGFDLTGHIARYLDDKYGGKPWDLQWKMVVATGRKP